MQARSAAGSPRGTAAARSSSGTARLAAAVALVACLFGVSFVAPARAHATTHHQLHKNLRGHHVVVAAAADTFQPPLRPDFQAVVPGAPTATGQVLVRSTARATADELPGRASLAPRTRGPPTTAS